MAATETTGILMLTGYSGDSGQAVLVVGSTPTKTRIRAITRTRLGGRNRWIEPGEVALVPKASVKVQPPPPAYPKVFEVTGEPQAYGGELHVYLSDTPSVGNGKVSVRRYRVTVEELEEPVEIIRERILALWKGSTNHHHWEPLRAAAAKVGLELK